MAFHIARDYIVLKCLPLLSFGQLVVRRTYQCDLYASFSGWAFPCKWSLHFPLLIVSLIAAKTRGRPLYLESLTVMYRRISRFLENMHSCHCPCCACSCWKSHNCEEQVTPLKVWWSHRTESSMGSFHLAMNRFCPKKRIYTDQGLRSANPTYEVHILVTDQWNGEGTQDSTRIVSWDQAGVKLVPS